MLYSVEGMSNYLRTRVKSEEENVKPNLSETGKYSRMHRSRLLISCKAYQPSAALATAIAQLTSQESEDRKPIIKNEG